MESILKYFNDLTESQIGQFRQIGVLYPEWNERINVISRKDISNLYAHHVLHSLVIARFLGELAPGTSFLDMGTGGGFPGIPLAIYYPHCQFHLIDRIGKKIRVATEIASAIGLENVTFQHGDIKECHGKFNYVVSRAVMPLNMFLPLVRKNVLPNAKNDKINTYADGVICLKGGDISEECKGISLPVIEFPIEEFIAGDHYRDKSIVYVPFN